MVIVIIGTQWGDEGKGKITDLLTEKYDIIARYQGGCNAGHTVVVGNEKYIFHLLPSGILHKDKTCLIGNGVVLDPQVLFDEIEELEKRGVRVDNRLLIDLKTHIIFPYHKMIDEANEKEKGNRKIGTTGKGIGPSYVDKYDRCGIRVCELIHENNLTQKLKRKFDYQKAYLNRCFGIKMDNKEINKMINAYQKYGQKIKKFTIDASLYLYQNIMKGKNILLEGAQGMMLDIDHGTYPFVTSSNPMAGCASTGCGISPTYIDKVIGITKAYTTRVGEGPFPTELNDNIGELMREKGGEYGATTGRPRRCGWFDAPVVKYANRINGIKEIVLTKLDVLSEFESIKVCTGYQINGKLHEYFPADSELSAFIEPVYEEIKGWKKDISMINNFDDLPTETQYYIQRIEALTESKSTMISVGPKRSQTILRD